VGLLEGPRGTGRDRADPGLPVGAVILKLPEDSLEVRPRNTAQGRSGFVDSIPDDERAEAR